MRNRNTIGAGLLEIESTRRSLAGKSPRKKCRTRDLLSGANVYNSQQFEFSFLKRPASKGIRFNVSTSVSSGAKNGGIIAHLMRDNPNFLSCSWAV
jgi:hypothetical protein